MAPKMGQPMEFLKEVFFFNFYEMSGNTHFLETLNPYFHCENWLFQLKFFRGCILTWCWVLTSTHRALLPLVLLFMINISEALSTEVKT